MSEEIQFRGMPLGEWIGTLTEAAPTERGLAAAVLVRCVRGGSALFPLSGRALKEGTAADRARVATLLGEAGGGMMALVPMLRDALETTVLTADDPALRTAASEALVRIGPYAHSSIPVLVDNLNSQVASVRWTSAHALGEIGPDALDALAGLTGSAYNDPSPRVRVEAAVAIWRIDRRTRRVLRPLIDALQDPDELVRWIAAECLGDIGTDAAEALPALETALTLPYATRLMRMGIETAMERIR
jgi:HEAT repeat protein